MRRQQIFVALLGHFLLLVLLGGAELALGKGCEIAVKATDDIVFDVAFIKIEKECKKLRINFKHNGPVLKHNLVLI